MSLGRREAHTLAGSSLSGPLRFLPAGTRQRPPSESMQAPLLAERGGKEADKSECAIPTMQPEQAAAAAPNQEGPR